MYGQPAAELGFEPGGLWGHDVTGVGNGDQLLHGNGIQCKSGSHFTRVNAVFQCAQATYSTYEVYALTGPQVFDVK